jgi:hypothetical protein
MKRNTSQNDGIPMYYSIVNYNSLDKMCLEARFIGKISE